MIAVEHEIVYVDILLLWFLRGCCFYYVCFFFVLICLDDIFSCMVLNDNIITYTWKENCYRGDDICFIWLLTCGRHAKNRAIFMTNFYLIMFMYCVYTDILIKMKVKHNLWVIVCFSYFLFKGQYDNYLQEQIGRLFHKIKYTSYAEIC